MAHMRVHAEGIEPERWVDRTWSAEHSIVPWLAQRVPLDGARVLEYGCGAADVSRAFAARAGHVLGLDIDGPMIDAGRRMLAEAGVENVTLEHHPVAEIVDAMRARAGEIDIVLLYAVVEHLSVAERVEVLQAAREVADPDGLIVVVEAPNRLMSFDAHSVQLPYFDWLPPDLKRLVADRSQRVEVREGLAAARAAGPEAEREWWVRFGTGVSHHEFELVFEDLRRHALFGGWDSLLCPTRPLHPGETALAADLERQRPDLGPMWSRYWLDVVLTPRPMDTLPKLMRPWTFDTVESDGVAATRWGSLFLRGPGARLIVRPPAATQRLVLGVDAAPGPCTIEVHADGAPVAQVPTTVDTQTTRYVDVGWDTPAEVLELRLSGEGHVVAVACET